MGTLRDVFDIGIDLYTKKKEYLKNNNKDEYINFLEATSEELKLKCEQLDSENKKLNEMIEELNNPLYDKNHAIILKWFEDTKDGEIEENEIKERLTDRKLKIAYYELIENYLIKCDIPYMYPCSCICYLNEDCMPKILKIIDKFFPEEKPAE